jgi:hypothetical protein
MTIAKMWSLLVLTLLPATTVYAQCSPVHVTALEARQRMLDLRAAHSGAGRWHWQAQSACSRAHPGGRSQRSRDEGRHGLSRALATRSIGRSHCGIAEQEVNPGRQAPSLMQGFGLQQLI